MRLHRYVTTAYGGRLDRHHRLTPSKPAMRRRPRQGRRWRHRGEYFAFACRCLDGGGRSSGARLVHALCVELDGAPGCYRIARSAVRMVLCGSLREAAALGL